MVTQELKVGGAVVFWSIAEFSNHKTLVDGLKDMGYPKSAPLPRTPGACLKEALSDVLGNAKTLIRPLDSKRDEGFCVLSEDRGEDSNSYTHSLTAKVNPDTLQISLNPFDDRANGIAAAFNKQLGLVRPAQVTGSMTSVLRALAGTSLRPKGSVYWIPDFAIDQWKRLSDLVELSAVSGKSAVYTVRNIMDGDSMKAIRDAIITEVLSEAGKINDEINTGELGDRALASRKKQAIDLHEKISQYEAILTLGLDKLHDAVDQAEQAVLKATMIGGAEDAA